MPIVNFNPPTNLFMPSTIAPVSAVEGQLLDLSLTQLVKATVVDVGAERAVLEINHQNYQTLAVRELQVGQKLELRVIKTNPQLEFRVLNNLINDRLVRMMPLLTRSFDWGQLIEQLQGQVQRGTLPPVTLNIYQQLQQLLTPTGALPATFNGSLARIVMQLQQLAGSELNLSDNPPVAVSVQVPMSMPSTPIALSPAITQLVKNLQNQLIQLPKMIGIQARVSWHAETRNFLASMQQLRVLPQLPPPQYQALLLVLKQFQQAPQISPQFASEVEQLLVQLEKGNVQNIPTAIVELPSGNLTTKNTPRADAAIIPEEKATLKLATEIKELLAQLPVADKQQKIAPELLGKLEGLLGRLEQLPGLKVGNSVAMVELATLITQLTQLVDKQPAVLQGEKLGVLSQLFGFHLEAELLRGKKKDALVSLKLSLLNMQKELGADVEEPLRRVELFQLCKAKFAEEQVQFLPLPFTELDEGYMLAERQTTADDDSDTAPVQMSLSLRLSALGNVRIDMLYGEGGLQLRLAGEDREKMAYLQNCGDELRESIQAITLKGVSFSADAKSPTQQLQKRLLPSSINILDARV